MPRLNPPPRFQLAALPTPLEVFPLSPAPKSGIEIFIKRDDLTGSELSGNKIRKLEFILYEAISRKADTLITCGGIQSNHCRATAALAAKTGLDCELLLKGRKPSSADGNLLLDILYKAKITNITTREYETQIDEILTGRASALKKRGKKPYIIPEGASNPLGMWGYVLAGLELKRQLDKAGISADYITCAVGSGGTYAGLYIASLLLNWPVKILGIAVCRNTEFFINRIGGLIEAFIETYNLKITPDPSRIYIDDSYIGPGYAKIGKKEADFIKGIAGYSGLILDPAYTCKAMLGMFDYIARGNFERKSTVIFIHTGGLLSIFAYKKHLTGN